MRLTAARIVVLMGKHAQDAFHDEYGVPVPMTFSEPRELEGRTRMVLQLPHPNARIPRAHCAPLSTEQLEMAQAYLRLA
jgi:uracil-DNA glycosylase